MPCFRQTSPVFTPASCSRRIAMICSSLNLERFIIRLPYHDGLYTNLKEFQGLRSAAAPDREERQPEIVDRERAIGTSAAGSRVQLVHMRAIASAGRRDCHRRTASHQKSKRCSVVHVT